MDIMLVLVWLGLMSAPVQPDIPSVEPQSGGVPIPPPVER
jgi:hypothetical protein